MIVVGLRIGICVIVLVVSIIVLVGLIGLRSCRKILLWICSEFWECWMVDVYVSIMLGYGCIMGSSGGGGGSS